MLLRSAAKLLWGHNLTLEFRPNCGRWNETLYLAVLGSRGWPFDYWYKSQRPNTPLTPKLEISKPPLNYSQTVADGATLWIDKRCEVKVVASAHHILWIRIEVCQLRCVQHIGGLSTTIFGLFYSLYRPSQFSYVNSQRYSFYSDCLTNGGLLLFCVEFDFGRFLLYYLTSLDDSDGDGRHDSISHSSSSLSERIQSSSSSKYVPADSDATAALHDAVRRLERSSTSPTPVWLNGVEQQC